MLEKEKLFISPFINANMNKNGVLKAEEGQELFIIPFLSVNMNKKYIFSC